MSPTLTATLPAALAAALAALAVALAVPHRSGGGVVSSLVSGRRSARPSALGRGPLPRRAWAGAPAAVLVLVVAGPAALVLCVVGGATLVAVGWLVGLRRAARRAAGVDERVRETCDALADDLAAGASAERALARAAADWPTLEPVLAAHRVGLDVPDAWRTLSAAEGAQGLRVVAAAWQVSARTGQGLALALRRVAADMRAAQASRRVVDSELSSARATGRLVAALPVAAWVMGAGAGQGQHPVAWLVSGPAGWVCLVLGAGLLLLGLGWIELLARNAAGP